MAVESTRWLDIVECGYVKILWRWWPLCGVEPSGLTILARMRSLFARLVAWWWPAQGWVPFDFGRLRQSNYISGSSLLCQGSASWLLSRPWSCWVVQWAALVELWQCCPICWLRQYSVEHWPFLEVYREFNVSRTVAHLKYICGPQIFH
jgi:hypothetical protein